MVSICISPRTNWICLLLYTCTLACAGQITAAWVQAQEPTFTARPAASLPAPAVLPARDTPDLTAQVRSGWVQFVRFEAPAGASVEIASSTGVVHLTVPGQVGLATGQDYRLRLSQIPEREGVTLFPTLRLIGYLLPPAGIDPLTHPIPIHFIDRDFDDASESRLVRNVVYLEDPISAIPVAYPPGEIPVMDVSPAEDVLQVSSELGRPLVLVQLGNRVPLEGEWEREATGPPVYFAPEHPQPADPAAPAQIQNVHWQTPGWMSSLAGAGMAHRHSVTACNQCRPLVRLPYQIHPRMPKDEYVCDGGDETPHVHFSGHGSLAGLQASETVAQFSRPGEKPRLVASNEVCVYAPRFGLLRSSAITIGQVQIEGPRRMLQQFQRGSMEGRARTARQVEQRRSQLMRQRQRPSTVAMTDVPIALEELRVIAAVHNYEYWTDITRSIGSVSIDQSQEARISMGIQAAIPWNRAESPAYTAITESGGMITGTIRTGELQQLRQPPQVPGELVLVKVATPQAAQQGDVIEFAIFYHNIGQRPVESVSIIDSLTARLEYVPDSALTDRRAVFTAAPNEVGSQELRWDVLEAIPGGAKGVVWFKAKVR